MRYLSHVDEYLTLKYKYKYSGHKYKYKYKYFKMVLEYYSSTSTSTNTTSLRIINGKVGNFVMVKSDLCCFISLTTMSPLQNVSMN